MRYIFKRKETVAAREQRLLLEELRIAAQTFVDLDDLDDWIAERIIILLNSQV